MNVTEYAIEQHRQTMQALYEERPGLIESDINRDILNQRMNLIAIEGVGLEDWDMDVEGPERSIVQNLLHATDGVLRGTVALGKLAWKGAKISHSLFNKGYMEWQARLDKSGAKDLERTEKLLASTKGDGSGSFVDKDLSIGLSVKGETPDKVLDRVMTITEITRHVKDKLIDNAIRLNADLVNIEKGVKIVDSRSYGQWAVKVADRMKKIPLWKEVMGKDGQAGWPGGYLMEKPVSPIDGKSEVAEHFSQCDKDIDLKKSKLGYTAEGTLEVLSRSECLSLFKAIASLINANMILGQHVKDDSIDSAIHASIMKSINSAAHGEADFTPDPLDVDRIKDTAKVLKHYDFLNYTTVIERMMKANTDYIAHVLKYCRKSIHKYEE